MPVLTLWVVGGFLALVQVGAAVPWLVLLDRQAVVTAARSPAAWLYLLAGVTGAGLVLALLLFLVKNPTALEWWGRLYGAVLHGQLVVAALVATLGLLLRVWPRGGAVAQAAFREGLRQPLFWLLTGAATLMLLVSLFVPYFTMAPEDEVKMVKQLGYDTVTLAAVAFAVITAATAISEEIEGRTAVTLMSKPVSRRQFLLGKFTGVLLAALTLMAVAGWVLTWALYAKPWLERLEPPPAAWLQEAAQDLVPVGEAASFLSGIGDWFHGAVSEAPGLVVGSGQVMVLLALAVTLATRLPMMVNLVLCLVLFFLGHLAPVLVQVSQRRLADDPGSATVELVHFMARLTDTLLPALEFVNLGPAILRDQPLAPDAYAVYVGSVLGYYVLYTAIVLLVGLILFEDRDLA
jgi:hypothetical protein